MTAQDDGRELSTADAEGWRGKLARYSRPSFLRGGFELAITAGPLALAWAAMVVAVHFGLYWLYVPLLPLAGVLLMRLFMIQHDCGHGAFFPDRAVNDWTGRVLSVLTLTPYDHWRRSHAIHHATSGNLDRRGIGDINTLTVAEYRALGFWKRLLYRLYRHPAVMFGLGPAYIFLLDNRLPFGFMTKGWMPWLSTQTTNIGIAAFAGLGIWTLGFNVFALIYTPTALVAASVGVWLFYVQHQFDPAHWERNTNWSAGEAALMGSSYYDLPIVLRWFTANIGVHHVHHLSSRIPYYRLGQAMRDNPALTGISRLTLAQSLKCPRLALWDEAKRRMVSFEEA